MKSHFKSKGKFFLLFPLLWFFSMGCIPSRQIKTQDLSQNTKKNPNIPAFQEKSIPTANRHPYSWYLLGRMHSLRGESKKAIQFFLQAVLADLEEPFLYYSVGQEYAYLEQYKKAQRWLKRAISHANLPEHRGTKSKAYYLLARIFWETKKGSLSQEYFRKSIKENPLHADAYIDFLKVLSMGKPSFKRQKKIAWEMLQHLPQHPESHFWVAKLSREEGQLELAHKHFSQTLNLSPEHKVARFQLAELYESKKQFELASFHYFALHDYHSSLWQARALGWINRLRNQKNTNMNSLMKLMLEGSDKNQIVRFHVVIRWLLQRGMSQQALVVVAKIPQKLKASSLIALSVVDCYYFSGQYLKALHLLNAIEPKTSYYQNLWLQKKNLLLQKLGRKKTTSL